ncbi:receptor-like serine/threonine-protein kinase SD1-8 isoform X2 [Cornus florida]|uniref:receptor-like serine/threonine-protein kinase SD1-8 isoform X2 n=1 Tax=Cornus florida TaxID=4283 RepID=UPI0028A06712|nr:receptor-like serine/threonine-protein kinase SD1-8 isoform X2 [Cornus florida]
MGVGKTRPRSSVLLHSRVLFFFLLWFEINLLIVAEDTISAGHSLSGKQTIISQGGKFELVFHTPVTSHKFYLAIWYKNIPDKTVVWVANRDIPLLDVTSELRLLETGNLALFDHSIDHPIWSTNTTSMVQNTTVAVLLDTGNLVLRDGSNPRVVFWESFDHPTDTWLPGGRLGSNKVTGEEQTLSSWIAPQDPDDGAYSLGMINVNGTDQLQLRWKNSTRYWTSGDWNGNGFISIPELGSSSNTSDFRYITSKNESYFTYSVINSTSLISRIVLNSSGQIKQLMWSEGSHQWESIWSEPKNPCEVFSKCGVYSSCDPEKPAGTECRCLDGFDPENEENWLVGNRTGGCVRRIPLQCGTNGEKDGFFSIQDLDKLPVNSESILATQSTKECKIACLKRCDCSAYTYDGGCLLWHGDLMNLQQTTTSGSNKSALNLRLAAAQLKDFQDKKYRSSKKSRFMVSSKQKRQLLTIGGINGGLLLLLLCFFVCYTWKRRKRSNRNQDLFPFGPSKTTSKDDELGMQKGHNLPLFRFATIAAATDNFSAENKLGEGGFGPVYKGTLLDGQEVAVKRLSSSSIQGFEEFKNEITLISELQHVNLVKLVGCCIEEEEKILIYEYMGNKSLDFFLFDPTNQVPLNWTTRQQIIEGIAQGLLYLHKYSRLRIIHRDLKASNILLDDHMKPKISDFGMARIYATNESRANTNRIVGTLGYMPPEYMVQGIFSVKSDVFSFGVLLLEIISGRKASSFYQPDHYSNLLVYTWELWKKRKFSEMTDPSMRERPSEVELIRYINVGLLCVQEHASDRPIMSDAIYMLSNESLQLPIPKGPAFVMRTSDVKAGLSPSRPRSCSLNNVTISEMEAR